MKRILIVILLVSLLLLTSCQKHQPTDYEGEYIKLESDYNKLYARLEKYERALSQVETDIYVVYDYLYYSHSDFTKEEAKESAINLYKNLSPLYK